MLITDYSFGVGQIIAVDPKAQDANGNNLPTVHVTSDEDGSSFAVPLTPALFSQYMPVKGMYLLYIRHGLHWARTVTMWGNGSTIARQGTWALNEGEWVIQAPTGLAYIKADQNGGITMVCGDTTTVFTVNSAGASLSAIQVAITTPSGISLVLGSDGTVSLTRSAVDGTIKNSITYI